MAPHTRPDVRSELAGLKDFQRQTVDHVHRRLWLDPHSTSRFLVADEVGLGKTLVARGLVTRTIDHLWESPQVKRIDIVYICSNQQIARQNIGKLRIADYGVSEATRLTLLPTALEGLRTNKVNVISLTPGTSFHVSESGGQAFERVVVQHMLATVMGTDVLKRAAWMKFFQGGAGLQGYRKRVKDFDPSRIDKPIARKFGSLLRAERYAPSGRKLVRELQETAEKFTYLRGRPSQELSRKRYRLVGLLRRLVARAAVDALEPDLVILDEFQRFKSLLHQDTEMTELAHAVFNYPGVKVVLLSATPYSMYTVPEDGASDDHYEDFLKTYRFLVGGGEEEADVAPTENDAKVERLVRGLSNDLAALRQSAVSGDELEGRRRKDLVEKQLRAVMCRTERLAATPDRDGMLVEKPFPDVLPSVDDVRDLRAISAAAKAVGLSGDVLEFWRSAPFLLQFMDKYQLKKHVLGGVKHNPSALLVGALRDVNQWMDRERVEAYRAIDPANARMRGLITDLVRMGADQVPWVPSSMPYYEHQGPFAAAAAAGFTKRLIFSAWAVVPRSVAGVVSYAMEQRVQSRSDGSAGSAAASYFGDVSYPLRWTVSQGRPDQMPVLALLHPFETLAEVGDPRRLAAEAGVCPAPLQHVRALARRRIQSLLDDLPQGPGSGREDERWYWAAPFALDAARVKTQSLRLATHIEVTDESGGMDALESHVRLAHSADLKLLAELGRRPRDLPEVLTDLALAAPGVSALRALRRVVAGNPDPDSCVLGASWIAADLRTQFNNRAIAPMIRRWAGGGPFWRRMLQACVDGNLQATLDEYLHVLNEDIPLSVAEDAQREEHLALSFSEAIAMSSRVTVDDFQLGPRGVAVGQHHLRGNVAARFGRVETDQGVQSDSTLRAAFNSPFWPFVLASTSIGQEGLDFHRYCHAVVHWNLPANPVDLEQREGRVHRYKGHAVRKNVGKACAVAALDLSVKDPWEAAFAAAAEQRPAGWTELHPYWVFTTTGGAAIERYVPRAPLSRECVRFEGLQRTVGAYRLVLGQPRQADLLKLVGDTTVADWMQIDLTPPNRPLA